MGVAGQAETIRRAGLAGLVVLCLACGGGAGEPVEPPTPFPGASPIEYPESLLDLAAEGETVLMVHVTTAGAVDTAYVLEPAPWSAFDSAALAGVRRMRFSPARQGSRRVALWSRLPVRFAPDTTAAIGLAEPSFESRDEP